MAKPEFPLANQLKLLNISGEKITCTEHLFGWPLQVITTCPGQWLPCDPNVSWPAGEGDFGPRWKILDFPGGLVELCILLPLWLGTRAWERRENTTHHLSDKKRNTLRCNCTGDRIIQELLRIYLNRSQFFSLDFNCMQRLALHMYRARYSLFPQVL